jgi:cytochrome P450
VFYRWLGIETLFVMEPEAIQTILLDGIEDFSKQPLYDDVFGEAIGGGLLNAEGSEWRWQRRLAAPLFRSEDMLAFVPTFAAACTPLLERWRGAGPGTSQNIDAVMTRATLRVLQDTVLGAHLSEADGRLTGAAFLDRSVWKLALASLGLPGSLPHPGSRVMARAGKTLRQVASRVLAETRAKGMQSNDLLGRLVTARDPATGESMPDNLIVDNVVTFIMAGHATTARALTWTLYLLALFPDWQEKVREEIEKTAGDGMIGRCDIAKFSLLDAVFQEAMRLYPPAPTLMRRTSVPVTLNGISLAAGSTVVIPIYVVHRHRMLWRDPLRFDPSRFSPEERAKRHRCAYLPFSTGPRSCVGGAFAMIEGKTMLATLLANARFELPEGEAPTAFARITLKPKEGIRLKSRRWPLRANPRRRGARCRWVGRFD